MHWQNYKPLSLVGMMAAFAACGPSMGMDQSTDTADGADSLTISAVTLPGKIEAENYRAGGEGVGFHETTAGNSGGAYRTDAVDIEATGDTGGGYNVGWVAAGEWLAYDVNVAQAATLKFSARVASAYAVAKSLHLELDGAALPLGTFNGGAGWQSYVTVELGSAKLTAGKHTLKLVFDTDKINVNSMTATLVCQPTTCATALANCGSIPDGCGGTLACGTCQGTDTCGGSGTPNVCGGADRFPGDPGVGRLYVGGTPDPTISYDYKTSFAAWEQKMGGRKMGIGRVFASSSSPALGTIDAMIAKGMIPHVSYKPGTIAIADIAQGKANAWLDTLVSTYKARAPFPIWFTFYHEPEDNLTTAAQAADYRAAVRYIYKYFKSHGVTNVAHVATAYMNTWSFGSASGRDWRFWHPDYKGTTFGTKDAPDIRDFYTGADSVVDILGLDTYMTGWKFGSALTKYDLNWFDNAMKVAIAHVGLLNHKAYAIPEFGFRVKQTGTFTSGTSGWVTGTTYDADTRTQMKNLYASAIANKVVALEYWNSTLEEAGDGDNRLRFGDPNEVRFDEMAKWIDDPRTVRYVP